MTRAVKPFKFLHGALFAFIVMKNNFYKVTNIGFCKRPQVKE